MEIDVDFWPPCPLWTRTAFLFTEYLPGWSLFSRPRLPACSGSFWSFLGRSLWNLLFLLHVPMCSVSIRGFLVAHFWGRSDVPALGNSNYSLSLPHSSRFCVNVGHIALDPLGRVVLFTIARFSSFADQVVFSVAASLPERLIFDILSHCHSSPLFCDHPDVICLFEPVADFLHFCCQFSGGWVQY